MYAETVYSLHGENREGKVIAFTEDGKLSHYEASLSVNGVLTVFPAKYLPTPQGFKFAKEDVDALFYSVPAPETILTPRELYANAYATARESLNTLTNDPMHYEAMSATEYLDCLLDEWTEPYSKKALQSLKALCEGDRLERWEMLRDIGSARYEKSTDSDQLPF